jgi:hypothetical protein
LASVANHKRNPDSNTTPVKQEYARGARGKFGKGNPGKPKGAVSWAFRKVSEAARELFEERGRAALIEILDGKDLGAKMRAIEFLADRAYGKAAAIVRLGLDPESPEGILLTLANQPLPGAAAGNDDKEKQQ